MDETRLRYARPNLPAALVLTKGEYLVCQEMFCVALVIHVVWVVRMQHCMRICWAAHWSLADMLS
jgi:hypothetical protein